MSLQAADPAHALFASCLDLYYIKKLLLSCQSLADHFLGVSFTAQHQAELYLIARLSYYFPSLLGYHATPGQIFCNLLPVHFIENDSSKSQAIRSPQRNELLKLAIAYSILPYLYDRRDDIWRAFHGMYRILSEKEDDLYPEEGKEGSEQDQPQSLENAIDQLQTLTPSLRHSYLTVILNAFNRCWGHVGADVSTRLQRILTFLNDLHMALFLLQNRYLEVAMRLTSTRLVSTTSPPTKVRIMFTVTNMLYLSWHIIFCLAPSTRPGLVG
jgi:hypothetical protein